MSETLIDYQRTVAELLRLVERIEAMAAVVRDAAEGFGKWPKLVVENSEATFSTDLRTNPRYPKIDAKTWPTAEGMASLLAEYHEKKSAVETLWDGMDEAERVALRPPTDF